MSKKLSLSKLQSSLWEKSSGNSETFSISDLNVDDEMLKDLIDRDISNSEQEYKLKK